MTQDDTARRVQTAALDLIRQYGEDAETVAMLSAAEAAAAGDPSAWADAEAVLVEVMRLLAGPDAQRTRPLH